MIAKIKKIIKESLILSLVLLIPLLAGFNLLKPGYFSMHDDVQIMRLYEMEQCLKDGQIPCRWVPDMGAGYGHPLYNYHPVFVYYAGMFFRLFNISFIDTSKLLFLFSLILSSLFMYVLSKEFFGKIGGVLSASIYILAPYRAVDIFVRGALTESWAFVFFPLILWSLYKLIATNKFSYFFLSILSIFGLLISHNTMPLIFFPVTALWSLFWVFSEKKWKSLLTVGTVALWAISLSAFFLIPSLLEIKLARLETMTSEYYEFNNHFVSIFQLFLKREWGYGPSILGSFDSLPFQLGWPMWPISLLAGLSALYFFAVKKIKSLGIKVIIFALSLFVFSVFMTHAKSYWLWNMIPSISFIQFPWRFLSIAVFAMALCVGGSMIFLKSNITKIAIFAIIIILTLFLNLNYFQAEKYYPEMTDAKKLSGLEWQKQAMTTLNDYVPSTVKAYPKALAPDQPWVIEGEAVISQYRKKSDFWRFTIEVIGNKPAVVEVPVFEFPQWETVIEQAEVDHSYNPETGVVRLTVPPGNHSVSGWFRNTPVRKTANVVTLLSFAAFVILIIIKGQNHHDNV